MGCDIHFFVEKRENGKWESADKWTLETCIDEGQEPYLKVQYDDRIYKSRNYNLFSILANVRNGTPPSILAHYARYGNPFHSVEDDRLMPICEPKGLPDDVCDLVRAESDRWDIDGHSHSWLALEELESYDWKGQTVKHRGWVNVLNYVEFKKTGKPREWSGGVAGRRIAHISNEMMDKIVEQYVDLINAVVNNPKDAHAGNDLQEGMYASYYTQVEWEESYAEAAGCFFRDVMPKLREMGNSKDVRIVFWFDN